MLYILELILGGNMKLTALIACTLLLTLSSPARSFEADSIQYATEEYGYATIGYGLLSLFVEPGPLTSTIVSFYGIAFYLYSMDKEIAQYYQSGVIGDLLSESIQLVIKDNPELSQEEAIALIANKISK